MRFEGSISSTNELVFVYGGDDLACFLATARGGFTALHLRLVNPRLDQTDGPFQPGFNLNRRQNAGF